MSTSLHSSELGEVVGHCQVGQMLLPVHEVPGLVRNDRTPRTVPPKPLPVVRKKPNKITPLKFIRWVNAHVHLSKRPCFSAEKKPCLSFPETVSIPREDNKEYCNVIRSWPRWVTPSFTDFHKRSATQVCVGWPEWGKPWAVLPYAPSTQVQRFKSTKQLNCTGENGITRKPTLRRVGSFFCPECFTPKVVGYLTIQVGDLLWNVPLWNVPLHEVPMKTLLLWGEQGIVFPRRFQSTHQRVARVAMDDDSYTAGATLGQTEVRMPVIRAIKGVFHKVNHKHVVAYDTFSRKHVAPVGYMVYWKVATL